MHLVLFDVDGTLILTGGAGMRAFYRAMTRLFDISVDREVIRPDGKTDPLILRELLQHFGIEDRLNDRTRDLLFATYLSFLDDEMSRAKNSGLIRILPGAKELLEMLSGQPDFFVGLVTGNLEQGAHIKLKNAGLDGFFRFGGYGSDSEDRTILTRIGINRGMKMLAPMKVDGIFVIGDTPLDIIHGHAAGARVIAVASAKYGLDELKTNSPDLLVPDLTSAESIVLFMRTTLWPASGNISADR